MVDKELKKVFDRIDNITEEEFEEIDKNQRIYEDGYNGEDYIQVQQESNRISKNYKEKKYGR